MYENNSNNFNNIEDTLEFKSDDSPKDLKNDDFTNVSGGGLSIFCVTLESYHELSY